MQVRWGRPPLPREHGAWAMLLTPPVVALMALGPDAAGVQAMLGWFAAYAARGPLEVLLGRGASGRSGMAQGEPAVARFWLLAFALLAALLLLPAIARQPWLLLLLSVSLVLALSVFWLAQHGEQRSLLAGLLAVTGLMAGAPLYDLAATAGVTPRGWALTYACFAFFAGSVFRVKTIARERRHVAFHGISVAVHLAFLAGAVAGSALGYFPALLPLAVLPPLVWAVVCALRARQGRAANLNRVGMSEIYLTILFAALTVLALRVPF